MSLSVEDPHVARAVELFEKGAAKEKVGKMSDAIDFYRQAFNLHSSVDKAYRHKLLLEDKKASEELLELMRTLGLSSDDPETELELAKKEPCFLLQMLTDDNLIWILRLLATELPWDWVSLSLTCHRLSRLGFESSNVWEDVAKKTYTAVYPQLQISGIESQAELVYRGWKNMCFKKPYIKFAGVYVSTCTYLREGSNADSSTWNSPIHIITYYRYVRFYRDGTCLRVLTTDEPQDVVPKLGRQWRSKGLKDVYHGFWGLAEDGTLTIEGEGSRENYQFTQELRVAGKHFNQLRWIRSFCMSPDEVILNFSLQNEKWFVFARVKSYWDNE